MRRSYCRLLHLSAFRLLASSTSADVSSNSDRGASLIAFGKPRSRFSKHGKSHVSLNFSETRDFPVLLCHLEELLVLNAVGIVGQRADVLVQLRQGIPGFSPDGSCCCSWLVISHALSPFQGVLQRRLRRRLRQLRGCPRTSVCVWVCLPLCRYVLV